MSDDVKEALFAAEVSRLHDEMTRVENAVFTPEEDDPRNLDPDDGPLEEMYTAAGRLEAAASQLKSAVSDEMAKRDAKLSEMSDDEHDAWEGALATKHSEVGT